jgi:hypothetical protein
VVGTAVVVVVVGAAVVVVEVVVVVVGAAVVVVVIAGAAVVVVVIAGAAVVVVVIAGAVVVVVSVWLVSPIVIVLLVRTGVPPLVRLMLTVNVSDPSVVKSATGPILNEPVALLTVNDPLAELKSAFAVDELLIVQYSVVPLAT